MRRSLLRVMGALVFVFRQCRNRFASERSGRCSFLSLGGCDLRTNWPVGERLPPMPLRAIRRYREQTAHKTCQTWLKKRQTSPLANQRCPRKCSIPRTSIGAGEEIRTPDPRITNALLYRLSYTGTVARPARAGRGLEILRAGAPFKRPIKRFPGHRHCRSPAAAHAALPSAGGAANDPRDLEGNR
jgi:hypothetical protein